MCLRGGAASRGTRRAGRSDRPFLDCRNVVSVPRCRVDLLSRSVRVDHTKTTNRRSRKAFLERDSPGRRIALLLAMRTAPSVLDVLLLETPPDYRLRYVIPDLPAADEIFPYLRRID